MFLETRTRLEIARSLGIRGFHATANGVVRVSPSDSYIQGMFKRQSISDPAQKKGHL